MSNSKASVSKFLLKPSSLSQHTVNFNKILEEKPTPKVENFTLKLTHDEATPKIATELNATTPVQVTNNENQPTSETTEQPTKPDEKPKEQAKPEKEFVFGEKLHDRVTITEAATSSNGSSNGDKAEAETDKNTTPTKPLTSAASSDSLATSTTAATASTTVPVFNTDDSTTHNTSLNNLEYINEIESYDSSTLLKLNCKLYILEANKVNWIERGYGILKVIETNDKSNVKLMMWTDKIFRLILNTKLFENMIIDKANNKSIRFNGYDNGAVRVFLIKTANANDCDELNHLLTTRAHLLATISKKQKAEEAINKENIDNTEEDKHILLKCECSLKKGVDDAESHICQLKVRREMIGRWSRKNKAIISIHEGDSINISSDLIHIKLAQKSKDTNYSFIISTPEDQQYYILVSDNQKLKKLLEIYDDILSSAYDEDDDDDVSNSDNNDSNLSPSSNGEKAAFKRTINRSDEKSDDSSQSSDDDDHATKKPKIFCEDS